MKVILLLSAVLLLASASTSTSVSASARHPRTTVVDAVTVVEPTTDDVDDDNGQVNTNTAAATAAAQLVNRVPQQAALHPVPVLPYAMLYRAAAQPQLQQVHHQQNAQVPPQVVLPQQAVATNVQFLPVGQRIIQGGLSGELYTPLGLVADIVLSFFFFF